ncbi:PX domain-containing protein, partial [Trichostrongylus colubriformis]
FAVLNVPSSGRPDICKYLMDHGARSYSTNSIGKTASELAAFVGQHECVSIINNHVGIDEIEKYLSPQVASGPVETYPEHLSRFIHKICSWHQVHPVAITMELSGYEDAMTYQKKILYVVDRVFERQLRCKEGNEVMSLKVWIILFVLREIYKFISELVSSGKNVHDACLVYAKYLLKWEPGERVRKNQETLLRNAIAAFPYHHSLLYETMVKAMTKTPFGERPTAFEYIVQGLFGQRLLMVSKFCGTCGAFTAKKRCPKCKVMFLEKINHVTGEREWEVAEEDHDLAQEIARSRFADMILDYNRNEMFLAGLRAVIQEKKREGAQAHVMDIGAGTGLLSLMAAREGADKVTAVEVFQPMAECARSIVEASEWHDKIEVLPFRSTDLSPLSSKPNIIVAEVFDTELIGEGALRTFKEALTRHVQFNRIPRFAEGVYYLNFDLKSFRSVLTCIYWCFGDYPLGECPGTSAVFDVQLSQLKQHQFTRLTEAFLAFTFDFESPESIVYDESFDRTALCTESGQVDAIFMWWDLDMDGTGRLWIDMSPKWSSSDYHWRDHWMQAVYYLPQQVHVKKGETLSLKCCHDEFSMWFSVGTDCVERIYCNCQLHTIMARQSIFSANEILEDVQFRDEVKAICEGTNAIVVGEGSMLFLLVAPIASAVTVVDSNPHFRDIISKLVNHIKIPPFPDKVPRYVSFYNFKNVTIVESVADVSTEPDVVVGEPFYLSAMTPWQNLRFWYDVTALQERFGRNITIQPQSAVLYGICERFDHLQNTGAPVGVVNGFDLSLFDDISQKARQATDALVDIHPLWEYEGVVKGEKFEVLHFDLRQEPSDVEANFTITSSHGTNGIPLWIEWHFGNQTITTGLKHDAGIGEVPEWKEGVRQGVYLLSPTLLTKPTINVDARFARGAGEIHLQFY